MLDLTKVFSFHATIQDRIVSRESKTLEFKETFNWSSKDKYAKSIAAFANSIGGILVFGVKDNPHDFVGLQSENFERFDESRITEYLNSVFAPEIIFEKFVYTVNRKNAGIVVVHQATNKPVVCIKNDGDLKESDIYFRYSARTERIKYPELRQLIEDIKEKERFLYKRILERISEVGVENAAIFDILKGEVKGQAGSFVIDKTLLPKLKFINQGTFKEGGIPVLELKGEVSPIDRKTTDVSVVEVKTRITNDPNAPVAKLIEPDEICPHRATETVNLINSRIGEQNKIKMYDLTVIRTLFDIDEKQEFYYHPISGSSQYSDAFIDWVVESFNNDNNFFSENREKFRQIKKSA